MPFNIAEFLPQVDHEAAGAFVKRYGNGHVVDWQQDKGTIAKDVVAALSENEWALGALESCNLIADSDSRDLLRSAAHRNPALRSGVDNIDFNDATCAVWLATQDREIFDLVVSAAHASKGLGSRSW